MIGLFAGAGWPLASLGSVNPAHLCPFCCHVHSCGCAAAAAAGRPQGAAAHAEAQAPQAGARRPSLLQTFHTLTKQLLHVCIVCCLRTPCSLPRALLPLAHPSSEPICSWQGAAEPLKFMGHGDCDNLSRSGGRAVQCVGCCTPCSALRHCTAQLAGWLPHSALEARAGAAALNVLSLATSTPSPCHPPPHRSTSPHAPVTLARFTDSAEDIGRECWELLRASRVPFADIRGMGITVRQLQG